MAAELRSFYSDDYIHLIGEELSRLRPLKVSTFTAFVLRKPWPDLTLKERSGRLTNALMEFLPEDPDQSVAILKQLLPKVSGDVQKYADMLSLFIPDYICRRKKDLSLEAALEALTFFTCNGTTSELAIRPFLIETPVQVMTHLYKLTAHPHPHVRRWASEGCRPRLPWAMALPDFKKDPTPILPVLEALRKDDSKFVQKSVANNLNDIAKDHPGTVLDFARKWRGSHQNTDWILKHGLRTLLKKGNPVALGLFGASPVDLTAPELLIQKPNLHIGESQSFTFKATMMEPLPEKLRIEYAVDFVKSNGLTSRKVFMIREGVAKAADISVQKNHRFTDFTTRKHYAGDHAITILVNGAEIISGHFTLTATDQKTP